MSIDVTCPECQQPLAVREEVIGKRVRCPSCKRGFAAREAAAATEMEVIPLAGDDDRPQRAAPPVRPRRRDTPRDESDDGPRRRNRPPKVRQVPAPAAPLVYGILSCLFPFGILGYVIAGLAISKANAALYELPEGKSGRSARKKMQIAKILAYVGSVLSTIMIVVAVILKLSDSGRR